MGIILIFFVLVSAAVGVVVPALPPASVISACVPGLRDFTVGDGKMFSSLELVPWETLQAGDSVRIFYRATPFKGKFMLSANGNASFPVRVCGVKGPNGERPVITGDGAVSRASLVNEYGTSAAVRDIHQARSVILVKSLASKAWDAFPTYIDIQGLEIRSAHPDYFFFDAAGARKQYEAFGGCIWLERGHNIRIIDNVISDCSQGVFTKSTDEGEFAITKDILLSGNTFSGHGIVNDVHMHSTYTASYNIIFEYNTYLPLRANALGNGPKDRSAGTCFRYNTIKGGAHAIDLVEAQDFPVIATSLPAYRTTLVYGNTISKAGEDGSFIHYGGDSFGAAPGDNWGEAFFRKGTLYFFDNTVTVTGQKAELFQLDTTAERAEVFNNVFVFAATVLPGYRRMRAFRQNVAAPYVDGGILQLGVNWISDGWTDSDPFHVVSGQLLGAANVVTGATPPANFIVPIAPSGAVSATTTTTAAPATTTTTTKVATTTTVAPAVTTTTVAPAVTTTTVAPAVTTTTVAPAVTTTTVAPAVTTTTPVPATTTTTAGSAFTTRPAFCAAVRCRAPPSCAVGFVPVIPIGRCCFTRCARDPNVIVVRSARASAVADAFPDWAIAVAAVCGALLVAGAVIAIVVIVRRRRVLSRQSGSIYQSLI